MIEGVEVNDISTYEDELGIRRISGITTNKGEIRTHNLVNCTGAWAPYIGRVSICVMVGSLSLFRYRQPLLPVDLGYHT